MSTLDKSTTDGTSGCRSDEEVVVLKRLGACFHGTGPDPANWLQFFEVRSLKRLWSGKDGDQGRLEDWEANNEIQSQSVNVVSKHIIRDLSNNIFIKKKLKKQDPICYQRS